jgi:cytochrome c553
MGRACHHAEVLAKMRAVEKGISRELLPVFGPKAVAAAVLTCAFGAPAFAQGNAPPPAPLLPIALEGNADRGQVLAETCAGCHGIPGYYNASPAYHVPKLGGQNADYIEVALQGYRRGTRSHPTMQAQASSLTDQDIADVAAFFAAKQGEAEVGRSSAAATEVEKGRGRATACVPCHGEVGISSAPQWPNLAGQHESNLLQALHQYKGGQRYDALMAGIVAGQDHEAVTELGALLSAQPHLHQTPTKED